MEKQTEEMNVDSLKTPEEIKNTMGNISIEDFHATNMLQKSNIQTKKIQELSSYNCSSSGNNNQNIQEQQGKMSYWTHLFARLNKSISQLYCMCEYESCSQEFCQGVIETMDSAKEDFLKLIQKMNIEENKNQKKSLAWELSAKSQEIDLNEVENIYRDLEDPENIDFTLFAQLITEQKMSVKEAMVLLVRESAVALNESQLGQQVGNQGVLNGISNISANNSFISKFSMEIDDVIKDLQEGESQMNSLNLQVSQFQENQEYGQSQQQDTVCQSQNQNQGQNRSRSNSPTKMNLEHIFKRLSYKFGIKNQEEEEEETQKMKQLIEKQLKAQLRREKNQENVMNFLKKEKQRGDQIKKKNFDKKQSQIKNLQQKQLQASQRQEEWVNLKKKKAKSEIDKIKEIEFITMLENQNKKLTMDTKLEETRERRKNILEQIQSKKVYRTQKEEQVEKRRIEKNQEKFLKAKTKMIKFEMADSRRSQILQEEKNKQNQQQNRVKEAINKKLRLNTKQQNLARKQNIKDRLKDRLLNDKKLLDGFIKKNKQRSSFRNTSQISYNSNLLLLSQQQQQHQQNYGGESINSLSDLDTLNSDWMSSGDEEGVNSLLQHQYNIQYGKLLNVSADNSADVSFYEEEFVNEHEIVFYQPQDTLLSESKQSQSQFEMTESKLENSVKKKKKKIQRKKKDTKDLASRKQQHFQEDNNEKSIGFRQFMSVPPLKLGKNGRYKIQKRNVKLGSKQNGNRGGLIKQKKQILKQIISLKMNNSGVKENVLNMSNVQNKENIRDSMGSDGINNSNKFKKPLYHKNTPTKQQQQQTCTSSSQIREQQTKSSATSKLLLRTKSEKVENTQTTLQVQIQEEQHIKDFEDNICQSLIDKEQKVSPKKKEDQEIEFPNEDIQDSSNSSLKKDQIDTEVDENIPRDQLGTKKEQEIQQYQKEEEEKLQQQYRWCSICNLVLQEESKKHTQSKQHKKNRNFYSLQSSDDQNCIICVSNIQDLTNERFQFLRKRSKKIKQRLTMKGLKHENACIIGKEVKNSDNKQRLQKISLDLEKLSNQQLVNYEALMNCFQDIQKIVDQKRESDLHVLRQIRFIPIMMEIFKKVTTVWPKNEMNDLMRVLDASCKVLQQFCGQVDNRTYLILTNRPIAIIDLLIWSLNRPINFVYSLNFVPILFNILIILFKHRVKPDYQDIQEGIYEYIFYSEFLQKIQQKFFSFYSGIDLSIGKGGKVPLALIKSVALLESIANYYSVGILKNQIKHSFNQQAHETIIFVLKETELCGLVNLIAAILLESGDMSKQTEKVLPQTILSLTMIGIKFLNNIARISLELLQVSLSSKNNVDLIYHIINLLVSYCNQHYDHSEDVKDLLNEVILLIGYYSLLNKTNQDQLCRGSQTIIQKLAGLPTDFFFDKKLKEVLLPTLIALCYDNELNSKILFEEMNVQLLLQFIQHQQQLYNFVEERKTREKQSIQELKQYGQLNKVSNFPNIFKGIFDQNYWCEVGKGKQNRSISISSNCSSQNSVMISTSNNQFFLFPARFPYQLWSNASEWITKMDATLY